MLIERRKFKRFDVFLDVEFKTSKESDNYFVGVTKNFSRNGLCFVSQTFNLALKEPLKLRVKLPNEDTFVPVLGDVIWKEHVENRCWVGIEFREIDKESKSQILDYAYDLWVEKNRKPKPVGHG